MTRDPVLRTLARLERGGPYPSDELKAFARDWRAARRSVRRLSGAERRNLEGVIEITRSLARRRMLAGRARPAFAMLRTNLRWFAELRRDAPRNGARRRFGTQLVWQLYDGSGWQLQPLATFGRLNGLLRRRGAERRVRRLVEQVLPFGVSRRGFLAFEYLLPWGGGRAGWVSGMAQATGMQALSGAAVRLGDERLLGIAGRMRGAFEHPPPWGVRVDTGPGRAHFLLYSHLPRLLVGNGFVQAILGLEAFRANSGDPGAARLVAEGLAETQRSLPGYDTGAWSLYHRTPDGPGRESDLHYHRVFTGFLETGCKRLGEPLFCRLAGRFAGYEQEPVAVSRLRIRERRNRVEVLLRVSKRGRVTVTLHAGRRVIGRTSRSLLRGGEKFVFPRVRTRGRLSAEVAASSLTGVPSSASTG